MGIFLHFDVIFRRNTGKDDPTVKHNIIKVLLGGNLKRCCDHFHCALAVSMCLSEFASKCLPCTCCILFIVSCRTALHVFCSCETQPSRSMQGTCAPRYAPELRSVFSVVARMVCIRKVLFCFASAAKRSSHHGADY